MRPKIIYLSLLTINYCIFATDVVHFISKYFEEMEFTIFIAFCAFIILIEGLNYTNVYINVITRKTRINLQLSIHIILALNSITWKIMEGDFDAGAIILVVMIIVNLMLIHKWIHKITETFHAGTNADTNVE